MIKDRQVRLLGQRLMQGRTQEPETSRPTTLQALLARARVLADDVVEENRVVVSADPDSEEAIECPRWAYAGTAWSCRC